MAAIERIRQGQGPQFLEFATYRWLEHCGPNYDNDIGYRSEEEFLAWKQKDPLRLLATELAGKGVISTEAIEDMKKELAQEVEDAFEFADASDFPGPQDAFKDLYRDCQEAV
jgi:pyruvate dehydrogenase E1 component alpha subunit